MIERYPIVPRHFAAGLIKSQAANRCIGMPNFDYTDPIELVSCARVHNNHKQGLDFILTLERSIKYNDTNDQCLDADKLNFSNCHHQGGNQAFKFDLTTRQLLHPYSDKCFEANNKTSKITLTKCDNQTLEQKWEWSYENKTALMNWDEAGVRVA